MQSYAGDVSCSRACQKSHGSGDVSRLAESFQRHVFNQFGALFFAQGVGHVGVNETGSDAVHGDIAAADFLRERLGETDHASLGGGVIGLSGDCPCCRPPRRC